MSSDKVRDEALEKAYEIVSLMLAKRPDVKQYMVSKGCHVMIIGEHEEVCDLPEYAHICNTPENIAFWNKRARGFGGAPEDDFSASCGEENVLAFPGDKYVGENILIHEFAHLFHTIGIVGVEPDFDDRLEKCRQNAIAKDCGRIRMLFQIKKSILQNVCSRSSTVTAIRRLRIKYTMP